MTLDSIKRHPLILVSCVIAIMLGIILVTSLWEKQPSQLYTLRSTGVIVHVLPFLSLQISPPGYPLIGESWKINVYIANRTVDGKPLYEPAFNSTVVVTVLSKGWENKYELRTDSNGEASFQFLPEYDSIAFQAYYSGISSEKVILSTSYISVEIVDTLLIFNAFSVIGSLASGLVYKLKKDDKLAIWINLTKFMSICVLCIFSFVTLTCMYSKIFLGTAWGYPENIIGSYITFFVLRYVFYTGVVLFLAYWIIKLIIRGIETKSI